MKPRRLIAWPLAASAAGLAVFLALAASDWPGFTPNGCRTEPRPTCFCERPRDGLVAQPANTWSNVGFIAVGLAIAAAADRGRLRRAPANPLTRTRFHPGLFATVIALLGPGSMFLHGSLTREGGALDVASMYLFAALLIAYGALRLLRLGRAVYLATFLLLAGGLIGFHVAFGTFVEVLFGVLIAAFAALEMVVRGREGREAGDLRPLALAGLLFGLAFAVWVPSLSGGALCDPASLLQGHALWHLLCAAAAGAVFLYLASEGPPADPEAPPRRRVA